MSEPVVRFEVLGPHHDRALFSCGVDPLDGWFRDRASQDQRRNVAQVFVALRNEELIGFYSLSTFSMAIDSIPPALAKKLPRYDQVPAALIGRLARAKGASMSGMGSVLLADALKRIVDVASTIGTYAVVVDAKDKRGKRFYEAHGFIPLASRPRRLFLPIQTVVKAMAAASR